MSIFWLAIPCDERIVGLNDVYCMKKRYEITQNRNAIQHVNKLNASEQIFACNDNTSISILLYCDGRSHCKHKDDETHCSDKMLDAPKKLCDIIFTNGIEPLKHLCPEMTQKAEFNFQLVEKVVGSRFVCIFEKNDIYEIAFYQNGSHLMDCHDFTCTIKYFKCPGFYCIPWRFVCNGLWECPGGTEERQCLITNCPGQYLCVGSVTCLSAESICDTLIDCPYGDDEYFCSPRLPECHQDCRCLLFAMSCFLTNDTWLTKDCRLPYVSITFHNSSFVLFHKFFSHFNQSSIFSLSNNNIDKLCTALSHANAPSLAEHLSSLDVSRNKIKELLSLCFENMRLLTDLDLSSNSIVKINHFAFKGCNKLSVLRLSNNRISILKRNSLRGIQRLLLLSLTGNNIMYVSMDLFYGIRINNITTDSYKICCVMFTKTECPVPPIWPSSCHRLLNDKALQCIIWVIAVNGLLLNLAINCKNVRKLMQTSTKNLNMIKKNYIMNVLSITLADTLTCVCLITVGAIDVAFSSTYLQNELWWRGSALCFMSAGFFLASNGISSHSIIFMAKSRYSLIKHPFDSPYSKSSFVIRNLILGEVFSMIIGFSLTLSHRLTVPSGMMPSGLCLLIGFISKTPTSILAAIWLLTCHGIAPIYIMIVYFLLLKEKFKHDKSSEALKSKQKRHSRLIDKSVLVSLSNLICWVPSCIIIIVTLSWPEYPFAIVLWASAIVIPINASINPFIFGNFHKIMHWLKGKIQSNL